MGEVVKYRGTRVSIGTCELLYYTSFQKFHDCLEKGLLAFAEGNLPPEKYIDPKIGFFFRFPFPDEDKLPFGHINGAFDRGIDLQLDARLLPAGHAEGQVTLSLAYQRLYCLPGTDKPVLTPVLRHNGSGMYYYFTDAEEVKELVRELVYRLVMPEQDQEQKKMYRQIGVRVMQGFGIKDLKLQRLAREVSQRPLRPERKKKGKGLS
jgi:hypothetical protein